MSRLQSQVKVSGDVGNAQSALKALSADAHKTFGNISRYVDASAKHFDALGTAVTALSSGVVLKKIFSLNDWLPIDQAMLRMQANWGKNRKEMTGFFDDLTDFSAKRGMDLDKAFNKGYQLSFIHDEKGIMQILNAAETAADATGDAADEMSDRITQIMKMYQQSPKHAQEIGDAIVASRLNIEQLDLALQRATKTGGASRDFRDILGFFGALQRMGYASPRVIQQMEAAMSALFEKSKKLRAIGVDPFKAVDGKKVRKSIYELLGSLEPALNKFEKRMGTDELARQMEEAFGPGTFYYLKQLISQRDKLKQSMEDQGNAAELAAKRSEAAEETWSKQLEKIKGQIGSIKNDLSAVYDLAKKPIKMLAENPQATKAVTWTVAGVAAAITGTLLYKKGRAFLGDIKNEAVGIAKGKAIQEATGVTPVYITNWPTGISAGNIGGIPVPTAKDLPAGKSGPKFIPLVGGATLVGAIGYGLGETIVTLLDSLRKIPIVKEDEERRNAFLSTHTWDQKNQKYIDTTQQQPVVKNSLNIDIKVDAQGRSMASVNDLNTDVKVNSLPRGDQR